MNVSELIAEAEKLEIGELTYFRHEIEELVKRRAAAELNRREEELNELRVLAGLKRKPFRKSASSEEQKKTSRRGRKAKDAEEQ